MNLTRFLILKRFHFLFLLFLLPFLLPAQSNTDFWFAAPEITSGHGDQPIYFRLTSFSQTANVTISEPANTMANFPPIMVTILANSTVTVDLTSRKSKVECTPPNTTLNLGLLIHSTVPITAYYEEAHMNNPEIFTLKGKNAMGTSFFIPSQNVMDNYPDLTPPAYNSFDIIATEDNTTITITPRKAIVGHAAGVPFTITLNKGQVYSAQATSQLGANHLQGSKVTSDKAVCITVKDDSDRYPGQGCWDLTGDQIVPVNIVGQEYIVVRGYTNSTMNDWAFITATVDNTVVNVGGSPYAILNAGETYRYALNSTDLSSYIETTHPAYVWHLTGYGCETGTALLPPMDCTGSSQVAFTRTTQYAFELIILTREGAQGSFTLDGSSTKVTASMFSPVAGNPAFVYARIEFPVGNLSVGAHILSNSQDIFHMGVIHTYDASQLGCSYGYFSDFASLNLGSDKTVCPGTSVTFDAGPNRQSYDWFFNGNPYASGVQTITVSNPGVYSVTVNDHGCILSDQVQLFNYPNPSPVIIGVTDFCMGASEQLSVSGTYSSYLWTTGETTQSITVSASGTYGVTVTNISGCHGSASVVVTVHPLPTVTLAQPASACINMTPYALTGGSPPGGVYSGPGVTSSTGIFSPSVAGLGDHVITYTYASAEGCSNSDSKTLTVYPLPAVQLSAQAPVCISASPYALSGGTPSGGTYSGPGVTSSTGIFSPSVAGPGDHTITYSYTSAEGCSSSASKTLTVYSLPAVQLAAQPSVCISAPPYALSGGTPAGGVYSGAGVNSSTGIFSPSMAGAGDHTITYTYTDANTCVNSASKILTVYALPVVQLAAQPSVCISAPPFLLTGGTPSGGVYSGSGVNSSTGIFSPSVAGLGDHTITYTYTSAAGCTNSDSKVLTVNPLPVVQLSPQPAVCISVPPYALSGGTPAGGTYSGSGVNSSTGIFSPSVAGTGDHIITYSFTTAAGCTSSASKTLTVYPLPSVQLSAQAAVCISVLPYALSGGTPAGGTYSGPGVNPSTGIFTPSLAGPGDHVITYTYTNANYCTNSASKTLTVYSLPVVQLADQAAVCISAPPFTLSGGAPAGGSYSGPGVDPATSVFDPSSGPGDHLITYTYTDANGCTNTAAKILTVNSLPVVQFPLQAAVCITAPPFALAGVTPAGGTYSGTGVDPLTGIFDPASGEGVHLLTYTYTDANFCTNMASSSISVIPLPLPTGTITGPNTVCEATQNISYILSGADPLATTFNWEISPLAAGTISGTDASPAVSLNIGYSGSIIIRFQPVSNCGAGNFSSYTSITVNPNPYVMLQSCNDPVTSRGAQPFLLKGGVPPDGIYAVDGNVLTSPSILDPSTLSPSPPDHTITYTYTNRFGCAVTQSQSLKVKSASGFICKNILTDIRDGKTYPTFEVVTGTTHRCWMSANLNYGSFIRGNAAQTDNCSIEKYCEGDDAAKCNESGALYQWDELMNYASADIVSAEGKQGLCPPEWHVATEAEWMMLENYYLGPGLAGWTLLDPNPSYGFYAENKGIYYQNLIWAFLPPGFSATLFWTSTPNPSDNTKILSHGLNDINPSVSKYFSTRGNALPVRCVKD